MPSLGDNKLEFIHYRYQHPVGFVVYADFESLILPVSTSQPSSEQSFTERVARHEACGYSYVIIGPDSRPVKPITVYRGADAAHHFVQAMIREMKVIAKILNSIKPKKLTALQELAFQLALYCSICRKRLNNDRVRDHDHLTGRYRSAVHNRCNLQFRMRKMIPVVFHNLKNYDAHLIVKTLGQFEGYEYQLIATNMERYITFTIAEEETPEEGVKTILQFIDSYQFLPTSLEKLVSNLSPSNFKILNLNFPPNQAHLLLRKGVYPYEYVNSFTKFDETLLPPITAFHSSLSGEGISDEDYAHALNVWSQFKIKNLGQYHDLYVKSDVLQLADVFENFRKLCLQNYDIDPAHLLTAPGLAWQASLKMTGQRLELLTDIDMHIFLERGIRGGISTITKRHAIANNPYLENYDSASPSKYLMYLDANNLYGWAMSQPLPYADFRWVPPQQMSESDIMKIASDSHEGYIFEVDLDYPKELHDLHNCYPLAAEKITITEDMLSPMCKNILQNLHHQKFQKCEKLVPNLMHKRNYITYYKNLQLYLKLGLKLVKIHRVLKFKQKSWLKPYINFNTEKRKQVSSAFEKDFFKLLNNSVFGKSMKNLRKHVHIELVNNQTRANKLIASPSFRNFKIFDENLTGVERVKACITLNRPIYAGFVILELSKVLMYDFHYNHILKNYGSNATLLFTDTDSLTYEIQTANVYEDMKRHLDLFDTSDYPTDHPLYSLQNKKKIGCFKDELNSKPLQEFVGLRAKMYSMKSPGIEKKTAKGVSRSVIKRNLKHLNYLECLRGLKATREEMFRISSESHEIYTIKQNKIALSPFDDKRYILDDGVSTLAYGHYRIGGDV